MMNLSAILDEAKEKRLGHLKTLNLAMLAYGGVALLLGLPSMIAELTGATPEVLSASQLIFDAFLSPLLTLPLFAGLMCLGLARAREQSIRVGAIFGHYHKIWPIFGFAVFNWCLFMLVGLACVLLITAASGLGDDFFPVLLTICILAAIVLSIYIGILLCFTLLLIIDQDLGVFAGMKRSISMTRKSGAFALLFKFYFLFFLWTVLGVFTLGIAYFWIFPKYNIAFGIIYRDLLDGLPGTAESADPIYEGPLAKYSSTE